MPTETAKQRAMREVAWNNWATAERLRVERQRAALQANLGPARAQLVQLMLDRAWELLDGGEAEAADALLEFVPRDEAIQLLDEFFGEDR